MTVLAAVPEFRKKPWLHLAAAGALFLLNLYICSELFRFEFLANMDSNEGVFVTLSRFYRENFRDLRWLPWFDCGVPIENAYQPLLPLLGAAIGWVTNWSVEHAFHVLLGLIYCVGPVFLYWFAWDWSRSWALSLTAGFTYSLTSYAQLFIPILRVRTDTHWAPLRLYNLVHYAEDPHNLSLTLLPLALMFLARACRRGTPGDVIGAILSSGAVVLANAFGAVDLVLGGLCIVLALESGYLTLAVIGVAGYLLISPWLPPSLIMLISGDQWSEKGGFFHGGVAPALWACAVVLFFAGLWWITRRLKPVERFSILLAPWMIAFPYAYFQYGVTLVPQGNRYQLELEMAMSLVTAVVIARAIQHFHLAVRVALIAALLAVGVHQTKLYRRFARERILPVEITKTIQYKMVHWLDRNLPGQRVMFAGDPQFLNNILTNNPQMGGGHEPAVPNYIARIAVFTIYSGAGAGDKDGDYSIFWLKAFGVQAVTVSGEKSRESSHGIVHPHKFDGRLPVLWHDEDDTIYSVTQRSRSLAHVVPKEALAARKPIHGLDIDPVRPYIAALDNPDLPVADFKWQGNSRFSVHAPMKPGQALSIQVNYVPGWKALVNGRETPVRGDGIGLMAIEPDCQGDCEVQVWYGVTTEAWILRILSGLIFLGILIPAVAGISSVVHKARFHQPSPR